VLGYYSKQYGWEVLTTENTNEEAQQTKRDYEKNEGGRYKIKKIKVQ
jgi:hypothetical protein